MWRSGSFYLVVLSSYLFINSKLFGFVWVGSRISRARRSLILNRFKSIEIPLS